VSPELAFVSGQMRGDRHAKQIIRNTMERNRIGHIPTVPQTQSTPSAAEELTRSCNRPRCSADQPMAPALVSPLMTSRVWTLLRTTPPPFAVVLLG
jgi:hypothetical protein